MNSSALIGILAWLDKPGFVFRLVFYKMEDVLPIESCEMVGFWDFVEGVFVGFVVVFHHGLVEVFFGADGMVVAEVVVKSEVFGDYVGGCLDFLEPVG